MRRIRPTNLLRGVTFLACAVCVTIVLRLDLDTVWRILAIAFAVAVPLAIRQAVLLAAASSESGGSSRWFVDVDQQRLEAMRKMLSKGSKHDPPAR